MARRSEETEIAGASWQINTLSSTKSIEVLTWLAATLGNGAGHLGSAFEGMKAAATAPEEGEEKAAETSSTEKSALDIDVSWEAVGNAAGAILTRLSDPKTPAMIKTLLADLYKDKRKVVFDDEFSGDMGTLFEVVSWALKINFASFLAGNHVVQAIAKKAGPLLQKAQT